MKKNAIIPILSITGSDGTGGSGIQADIKTSEVLGAYSLTVVTAVTVQDTRGIRSTLPISAETIDAQLRSIIADARPNSVKIGMLCDRNSVSAVARHISGLCNIVLDSAFISSRGERIASDEVIQSVCTQIIPLCDIVIMKRTEAELLLQNTIQTRDDLLSSARSLTEKYKIKSLILRGDTDLFLFGEKTEFFALPDYSKCDTHGLATTLSASVAIYLAFGNTLPSSVACAYNYLKSLTVFHIDSGLGHRTALLGHKTRKKELYNIFIQRLANSSSASRDVAFYADSLSISPRYLSQITLSVSGKTPKELISEFLAKEASILLASTTLSVQEIAFKLGFSSQAQFSKFFKKNRAKSPTEYRGQ